MLSAAYSRVPNKRECKIKACVKDISDFVNVWYKINILGEKFLGNNFASFFTKFVHEYNLQFSKI